MAAVVNDEEQPMFDVATPPVRKSPRTSPATAARPKWTKYKRGGVKCDDCMAVLFEAKGEGPASLPARWRRLQGKSDLVLCYGHAAIRRADDGMKELK